jgi:hypothetical protein
VNPNRQLESVRNAMVSSQLSALNAMVNGWIDRLFFVVVAERLSTEKQKRTDGR